MPHCLSAARIALALVLLTLLGHPGAFLVVYAVCALTDVLDGWLARRLGVVPDVGARLNTLADGVLAVVLLLVTVAAIRLDAFAAVTIAVVLAVRVWNLALTRALPAYDADVRSICTLER